MSRTHVFEWCKHTIEGREEVEDVEHPGRFSKSKAKKILRQSVKLLA
jgi:hypothetical protein